jgi:hypothetical protein
VNLDRQQIGGRGFHFFSFPILVGGTLDFLAMLKQCPLQRPEQPRELLRDLILSALLHIDLSRRMQKHST